VPAAPSSDRDPAGGGAPPRRAGRYVVLEGGEGVGKSTQVRRLADRLAAHGVPSTVVREPGGDAFAEAGRRLLLGDLPRTPEAEVLAFNALRAQLLVAHVRPALAAGTWVLADRGRLSTLAYQGHGHGVDLDWVRAACRLTSQLCPPDLEVVLTVDEATARARRDTRGTTDRFERLDDDFHRRVAAGYAVEATAQGAPVVDGSAGEEEVTAALWRLVAPLLSPR
jgi:dTMP kinase